VQENFEERLMTELKIIDEINHRLKAILDGIGEGMSNH
jgi:hypothetical protein